MKEKKKKKLIQEYCCGCGLCQSRGISKLKKIDGFLVPDELSINELSFYESVCPFVNTKDIKEITGFWGDYVRLTMGYAVNDDIRRKASSGGVITAVLCYLLDYKIVDAVIHVGASFDQPWETNVICSSTREEVITNAGSRYAQSSPLINIDDLLKEEKKFAFVGKPCDIRAIKNYQKINELANQKIILTISFFCMGTPSENANIKLLNEMGISQYDCISMRYRGNGWPGYASVIDKHNNVYKMSYNESWGKILGRDLKKCCKFCIDGIGMFADISCADGWYLNENNKPDFSEKEGRNIIFSRTKLGDDVILNAIKNNYITEDKDSMIDENYLKYIQPSQYKRIATMSSKLKAMQIFNKIYPNYDKKYLKYCASKTNFKTRYNSFKGTVGRIIKKSI